MSQSRSAFPVTLELYEVEALIDWHEGNEHRAADDYDYPAAENSKCRGEDLKEQLLARRQALTAENA